MTDVSSPATTDLLGSSRVSTTPGRPTRRFSRSAPSTAIGALFLAGFASYGTGFALVTGVTGATGAPGFLATVPDHRTALTVGAVLLLLNSVVDVAKGVLFFPILAAHGRRTALAYLAAMVVEVVLLSVGALGLLMLLPLSRNPGPDPAVADTLASLAVSWNSTAYQIGEAALCIGALLLCRLLLRTRLIPAALAGWGVVGYTLLLAGSAAELFGLHVGLLLSLPGGVFEVALGLWLLIKGLRTATARQA